MASRSTEIRFHNAHGVELAATLLEPDGDVRVPGVLLCQGLSGVRNLVLPEVAEVLAARGIASLRFDYAGFGDSEGQRGWIDPGARVADAQYALEVLLASERVDVDRIGVYGHSAGGPVGVHVAAADPRVRALVAVSGPGSGQDMLRAARPAWDWVDLRKRMNDERARIAEGGEPTVVDIAEIFPFSPKFTAAYARLKSSQGGTSALVGAEGLGTSRFYLASIDALVRFHPEQAAVGLDHCPTLWVSGQDDDTAPIETVEPVFRAIPGTKRWILIPGADHNDLDSQPGLGRALGHCVEWFLAHL